MGDKSQPVSKDEGQNKKKQDFCHGPAVEPVSVIVVCHEITCSFFIITMYMGKKEASYIVVYRVYVNYNPSYDTVHGQASSCPAYAEQEALCVRPMWKNG